MAQARRTNRRVAAAVGSLLAPVAAGAGALGIWRVAADLKWTSDFAIHSGLFSHWQVWFVAAVALQLLSHALNRYGTAPPPEDIPIVRTSEPAKQPVQETRR